MKQFKNPSSYQMYRGKKMKRKLFYGVILFNGVVFYASRYNTDLYFHFEPTQQNLDIIKNCDQLRKGTYKSTFYLCFPFLMSVYGAKMDPIPYIKYDREFVDLPDGGHMSLDWSPVHNRYEDTDDMRICVILHGLTGGSLCNYTKHAALNAYRFGFRTVCVNFRGIDSPMKNGNINDFSKVEDLNHVINEIQKKYPKANIYGMGISMGANQLLKYAGEKSEDCKLKAIVSISNPWDIEKCSDILDRWDKKIYNWAITKNFVRNYKRNYEQMSENIDKYGIDEQQLLKSSSMKQYDELFTKKVLGISDIKDYYKKASCAHSVKDIKVPVLAIQALDDPVCNPEYIPKKEIKENDNMILVTSEKGGHIDYFTGFKAIRWVYWPAMEYLNYVDNQIVSASDIQVVN